MWRASRRRGRLVVAVLAAWIVFPIGAAWPAVDNVAAMLAAIESARTLDDVHREYAKLRLTAADEGRLASALQGSPLSGKLTRLVEQSKAEARAKFHLAKMKSPRPRPVDAGPTLVRLNQQADAALARLRSPAASLQSGSGPGVSGQQWPAEMGAFLAAGSASDPNAPRIQTVSPRIIEVGGEFTITGIRLGERGEILLGLREPHVAVEATEISHWGTGRIVGTVPLAIDEYLTQGATNSAVLWVKPAPAGTRGVGEEVQLLPLRPRITSLSSDTVSPGQEIVVAGSNCGPSPGRIDFEFAGRRLAGEIRSGDWTPTAVRVRLGDLDGLVATGGRLHLETDNGRTTSHPIRFQPSFATLTFVDGDYHHYTPATFGPEGNREMSALVHFPELRDRLENQWIVESAVLERSGQGSCRYDPPPVLGGAQAPLRIVIEADAYETVFCTSTVTLRGPRNTPYYR